MSKRRVKKLSNRFFAQLIKHIQTPIGITIVVGILLIIIISILDFKYLETNSGRDILIEAHGLLFDIFVFGVLLAYLNKFLEKKQRLERYNEEVDDFRGWDEKEAKYRIVGNIKRLNKLGFGKINLSNCYLAHANLQNANLVKAKLKYTDLSDANLVNADLSYADLTGANLTGADLSGTFLRGAKLNKAILKNSILKRSSLWRANLQGADLTGAILKNTNLLEANLSGVIHTNTQFFDVNIEKAVFNNDFRDAVNRSQKD